MKEFKPEVSCVVTQKTTYTTRSNVLQSVLGQPQLINTGVTPSKSKTNRSKIDLLLINLLAAVLVVDPVTARSENIQKFVCLQAQLPARPFT